LNCSNIERIAPCAGNSPGTFLWVKRESEIAPLLLGAVAGTNP
jgi:hypothetical protein